MFKLIVKVDLNSELGKKGWKEAVMFRGTKTEMNKLAEGYRATGRDCRVEKE